MNGRDFSKWRDAFMVSLAGAAAYATDPGEVVERAKRLAYKALATLNELEPSEEERWGPPPKPEPTSAPGPGMVTK